MSCERSQFAFAVGSGALPDSLQTDAHIHRLHGHVGSRASLQRGPALEEVLVTTADSRLRLYQTDTFNMTAKYKGHIHEQLHIGARCVDCVHNGCNFVTEASYVDMFNVYAQCTGSAKMGSM